MSRRSSSREHGEHKSEKNLLKSLETPEQKRLRRFLKKEAKERKRKEQMGWDEEYMGYTNTDNPFGDTNLLKTFVWEKKFEKEGLKSLNKEEIEKRNKMKLEENRLELEKVKQRRLEREREKEIREEELTRIQREKEAAQFKEWEKQEDTFHLKQAKLRSKIRIQDGRAKPIDLLARYVSTEDEDFTVEMNEPYVYLNGLRTQDLEDLQEDIKIYMELENGNNSDYYYWKDLQIIVEDEIHKLRSVDSSGTGRRDGINTAVGTEIVTVFKGKTPKQLQAMYTQIEKKIASNEEGVDIGYWEALLSRLKAYMARARLRERHQEKLRMKLFQLKQEQGVEQQPLFPCVSGDALVIPSTSSPIPSTSQILNPDPSISQTSISVPSTSQVQTEEAPSQEATSEEEKEQSKPSKQEESYNSGRYSPTFINIEKLEPGVLVVDPVEDTQRLEFMRKRIVKMDSKEEVLSAEDKVFDSIARKGMDADEAIFNVEFSMDRTYLWSDKYRPRKPRYFNRVHTGFEWNKYNQTHYDMDNPPPKIVQGYKFNIFYPDLIDKAKTPEYTLTPCEDNKEFAILRFHSGPPYEDIAFKIVNREWEYSYKRGFRCQFHNNIFQLWFHFKRYRYRR